MSELLMALILGSNGTNFFRFVLSLLLLIPVSVVIFVAFCTKNDTREVSLKILTQLCNLMAYNAIQDKTKK